eukprot:TRINITY_DN68582_c0_g1_i1.p1 TRINITY_DN68582_c0_g1~~TRINITY_DN68582_c0_g1_i1.p1  ORF type:complete len:369 (+),score=57.75 TRINITY_DN68582_c0_g1_i1:68-1174(+)
MFESLFGNFCVLSVVYNLFSLPFIIAGLVCTAAVECKALPSDDAAWVMLVLGISGAIAFTCFALFMAIPMTFKTRPVLEAAAASEVGTPTQSGALTPTPSESSMTSMSTMRLARLFGSLILVFVFQQLLLNVYLARSHGPVALTAIIADFAVAALTFWMWKRSNTDSRLACSAAYAALIIVKATLLVARLPELGTQRLLGRNTLFFVLKLSTVWFVLQHALCTLEGSDKAIVQVEAGFRSLLLHLLDLFDLFADATVPDPMGLQNFAYPPNFQRMLLAQCWIALMTIPTIVAVIPQDNAYRVGLEMALGVVIVDAPFVVSRLVEWLHFDRPVSSFAVKNLVLMVAAFVKVMSYIRRRADESKRSYGTI